MQANCQNITTILLCTSYLYLSIGCWVPTVSAAAARIAESHHNSFKSIKKVLLLSCIRSGNPGHLE